MSWQSIKTRGYPTPRELYEGMQSKGVTPIILKWNTPLRTIQNVYGLTGFSLTYDMDTSGLKHVKAEIDQKEIVMFHPDEYGEAWAVVPMTDKNLEVLRGVPKLPWSVFEPKNLMDGVKPESEAKKPEIKKTKPEPKTAEKGLRIEDLVAAA